jgi:hypothetical protein
MINNIAIVTAENNFHHQSMTHNPESSRKSMDPSTRTSKIGKMAMALPALRVSSNFLSPQHQRPISTDPLIRAVEAAHTEEKDDFKSSNERLSPTSASYMKPFPTALAPLPTTPTNTNPFDAIYNNPGRWSQGAFVTAAHKRKKSRQLKFWLVIILAVLSLMGITLIVYFCYPRNPSIRVTRIRKTTDDTMSMVKLTNNPASATFNFSMEVRIKSSNYLITNIGDMTCFGYHPKQPINVIATSAPFSDLVVPPQDSLVANSSLIVSLVTPSSSAAVFTTFLGGCGLVGINSAPSNTTTGNTTNGTNIPQVVDRPQNRLLFRCTARWTVGATTRQTEFDSTLSFECPAHLESQPNLNRTFVFLS